MVRYTVAEVSHALIPVLALLVVIFAAFDTARSLTGTAALAVELPVLLELVALRTLIALDVLLPLGLYLAVVIALGRLHHDHEVVALRALGFSAAVLVRGVLVVAVAVAVVVGGVSLFARAWAYERVYTLEAEQGAEFELDDLAPGHFQANSDTGRVVHARARVRGGKGLQGFLLYERQDGVVQLVLAERARQPEGAAGRTRLLLDDGAVYGLDRDGGNDRVSEFNQLTLRLEPPSRLVGYKRKAAATAALLRSQRPDDIAEWQWRASRPLATLLLALLAVPLSATAPRRGRYARVFTAMGVFALYFVATDMARSWVEQSAVGAFPGVWWVPAVAAAALLGLWARRAAWRLRRGGAG
ncbi:LPS export ABC transporter permease LptF [Arhodomonas aquaeolei]|uniref:LPS export ABC transporter permease LptF n=1 Tax=Arhodomonas aquaeolei TaxID=2369 RepID=UPI00037BE4D2|nr:LPS export ABC transporter permease LptF [Arhodomonas aquaeolei]